MAYFMPLGIFLLLLHTLLIPRGLAVPHTSLHAAPATAGLGTAGSPERSSQSDPPTYTLKGTVVNSVTGEPIRGALVQIYADRQRSVLTGPEGKFQIENLSRGTFGVQCRKPGY